MLFRQDRVYSCGPEGGEVAGLVRFDDEIRPRWAPGAKLITWVNPGGRQRAYEIATVVTDDADRFVFVDRQGRTHELRELTPSYYNEHIRREKYPELFTTAELLAAFRESLA